MFVNRGRLLVREQGGGYPTDISECKTAEEAEQRAAVLNEAHTWVKTPYHHEACRKGEGVDCAYYLIGVYSTVGLIKFFRPDHYPPDWALNRDTERYVKYVMKFAGQVEKPLPGDVVLYKVGRAFSHAGIVVRWPDTLLHASSYDKCVNYGHPGKDHRLMQQNNGAARAHVFYTYWV
jgi:cell wall-associated NlpC family hydrolase